MITPMYDVVGSWNCKWIRTLENRYLRLTHIHKITTLMSSFEELLQRHIKWLHLAKVSDLLRSSAALNTGHYMVTRFHQSCEALN